MEAKIAKLNNGEKLRKAQPRYYARPMGSANHSRLVPARMNPHNKRRPHPHAPKPFLRGARCGEIFVAHNARQWTFVCTFCNKSTRDIGDFICHIKARHLQVSDYYGGGSGDSYDDYSEDEYYQPEEADVSNYHARGDPRYLRRRCSKPVQEMPSNQHQRGRRMPQPAVQTSMSGSSYEEQHHAFTANSSAEYLDYGNYLDVNVHSENEAVDYDQQEEAAVDPKVKNEPPDDNDVVVSRPQFNSAIGLMGVKKNADRVELKRKIAKETKQKSMAPVKQTLAEAVMNGDEVTPSTEKKRKRREEETEQNSHHEFDDSKNGDNTTGTLNDEENDFDNQLLMVSSNPLEPSVDMRGKRRQIRGTAYCALCNRTFQYYSLYRNHMIKHSNETPYRCELCDKGFKSKQAIRYHMNTHKRDKPHKCLLCQAAFYTESQFITHMSTHEDGKTFPCSTCAEILTSEKERELHTATHTEDRPFCCDFCQKRFRMRHHLSNHLKMHRQYRCDFCKEDFTSDVHLRKPYACDKCAQTSGVTKIVDTSRLNISKETSGNHDSSLFTFESVDVASAVTARRATTNSNSHDNGSDYDEPDEDEEDEEAEELELVPEDQHSDEDDVVEIPESNDPQHLLQPAGGNYQAFGKKRLTCKYCSRSYSHISGLNFHIRNKHMS